MEFILGALIVGILIGLVIGYILFSDSDSKDSRFGPCPRCGNMANLEEWNCGSCGKTFHQM